MTLESPAWRSAACVEQGGRGYGVCVCGGEGGSLCSRLRESIKASTDNYKPAERRGWLIVQCSMPRAQPRGLSATLSFPAPLCGPQTPQSHIPQPDNATVRLVKKAGHVPVINFLHSGHSLFWDLKEILVRFTPHFFSPLRLPKSFPLPILQFLSIFFLSFFLITFTQHTTFIEHKSLRKSGRSHLTFISFEQEKTQQFRIGMYRVN